ncbi:Zn-dependent hydrolase [Waterburya agarophytonicola K14]|uniref:Zn-dependent hydrolase n=1 Tax=Waterburya agarophytonicola KI4 TaxID=2874699 RepID=A0A964FMC2_9CYAN|nr:Zn-dependent hydrolase [Waterburya agarophytonicola]MCC0179803.1 Zn-dependent hydrolase [Waterburya agarophytonicola KI4]
MKSITTANLLVNGDRLNKSIASLASIGRLPNSGVKRIAYSTEDLEARTLVQQWMKELEMEVKIDAAGNIIGKYPGKNPVASALATGSHIDTVPCGGNYDGAYGVLAGLEVVRVLQENQIRLERSIEVIVFTDEEGSMIGSKAISGRVVRDPQYYRRPDGTDIQTCLKRVGGNWDKIPQARRNLEDIAAFVELHVEQGPVLESMGKQIGVIEGIVGQRRFNITVKGSANHAGTTPMQMRCDALVAASQVVLAVNQIGNTPGQQVATVGKMSVLPNAANVVPGWVEMSLDIRDLSSLHLDSLLKQLRIHLEEIAVTTNTQIRFNPCLHNEPALAEPYIQKAIALSCENLSLSYTYLPSRASHDAQEMAQITDMGMIFVPSKMGVSHDANEYTSPEQCIQGANVLLQTLIKLGKI